MKFPPWWGYGYFLELHNRQETDKKVWVLALIEVIVLCLLVPGSQFREVGEGVRQGVGKKWGKEKQKLSVRGT